MSGADGFSPIELLLPRLEGVKGYAKVYRARCPACGGGHSKLSMAETASGSVLMHCFGLCSPGAVLAALGMTMADLYHTPLRVLTPVERRDAMQAFRQAQRSAALALITEEIELVVAVLAALRGGASLEDADRERLAQGARRLDNAFAVLGGKKQSIAPGAAS